LYPGQYHEEIIRYLGRSGLSSMMPSILMVERTYGYVFCATRSSSVKTASSSNRYGAMRVPINGWLANKDIGKQTNVTQ
jgi:hypothetical protein